MKEIDEGMYRGIASGAGTYTAHTGNQSKTFKTYAGAAGWFRRLGIQPNGEFAEPRIMCCSCGQLEAVTFAPPLCDRCGPQLAD